MKTLLNLDGVTFLSKEDQKTVSGGYQRKKCKISADPSTDWCCHLPLGCPQF